MARTLRIEFTGAFYHVMSRGNQAQPIYSNHRDRSKFLEYLESASDRYGAKIHCYCLMDNHYHLLLETPHSNLAQIMRHINGSYTAYFNATHRRVGHLFQGRYRSVLIDVDKYCLALSRFIHLSPVKEGVSSSPAAYEWSSYHCYTAGQHAQKWLLTDFLLSMIGAGSEVRTSYQQYVEAADNELNDLYARKFASVAILGRREFVEEVCGKYLPSLHISRDLPATREMKTRPEIQKIIDTVAEAVNNDYRLVKKVTIYLCHHFSGCSLKEIGAHFGIGESAVSENSKRFAMTLYKDQRLAEMIAGLLADLKM